MKLNKSLILIFSLVCTFASQISAIASYKAIALPHLGNDVTSDKEQSVTFNYKIFDKKDCKKYLGRSKILCRGYQPIQIKITNNTDRYLKFSLNQFSFPCVSYEEVVDNVQFNTSSRIFGWGIGSIFFLPFIIPAIIEAVKCPKANQILCMDFAKKALVNQIIKPYSSINGLVFTAVDHFDPEFSFVINDNESDERLKLSTTDKYLTLDEVTENIEPVNNEKEPIINSKVISNNPRRRHATA